MFQTTVHKLRLALFAGITLCLGILVYSGFHTYSLGAQGLLPDGATNVRHGEIDPTGVSDPLSGLVRSQELTVKPLSGSYLSGTVDGEQGGTVILRYSYEFANAEEARQALEELHALATKTEATEIHRTEQAEDGTDRLTFRAFGDEGDEARWQVSQHGSQVNMLMINGFDSAAIERLFEEQREW